MLAGLADAKLRLKKCDVRVTDAAGKCHMEDATGAKLADVAVLDVLKASMMSAEAHKAHKAAVEIVPDGNADLRRLVAPPLHAHGSKGDLNWPMPHLKKWCEASARPGYLTSKAHEYVEEEEVLHAKVRLLASMLKSSTSAVAYTGAGISVSAGIPDWATKHADRSAVALSSDELASVAASATPTLAHRVLTAAHFAGFLPKWVQQNHDGLPQKAGFPQKAMNEIHGAIFDPSNPLVEMEGKVRDDLHTDLLHSQRSSDLVLALGSSLAGMAADELVTVVADRARRGKAIGVVIISLQQTARDEDAALRIFAPLDRVAALLAEELDLIVQEDGLQYVPHVPAEYRLGEDIYSVRYAPDGSLLAVGEKRETLDLSHGATVKITAGPKKHTLATVDGRDEEGHYRLRLGPSEYEQVLLLGAWWIEAAVSGSTDRKSVV